MAGESEGHRQLKRGAFLWAQAHGYTACAEEVRLPNSGYRADVVACKPGKGDQPGPTAIFECKWARSDFLGDAASLDQSTVRLRELNQRREVLERNLTTHHPGLRAGETLFPEYDVIHLEKIDHQAYRSVVREIQTLQRKISGGSKFDRIARYRCADLCYLVVKKGICDPNEIPPGWGLLEWDGKQTVQSTDLIAEQEEEPIADPVIPALILTQRPIRHTCTDSDRLAILRRIAQVATRMGNKGFEIPFGLPYSERRRTIE